MAKGFPYEERARAASEAHRLSRLAFSRLTHRSDEKHPTTTEWNRALAHFSQAMEATFPGGMRNAWAQLSAGTLPLSDILDFLAAHPYFPNSGYFKSAALRRLKHLAIDQRDAERLRHIIIAAIERGGSQELRGFFRHARRIKNVWMIDRIVELTRSTDPGAVRRARRAFIIITDQLQKPERFRDYPWLQPHLAGGERE